MEQPVGSARDDVTTAPSPRGRWWFVFAGLWLALGLRWVPVDRLAIALEFGYFLPLLMGWMAHRYRSAAIAPLLVLAIPSLFRLDVTAIEWFSLSLRVNTAQYLIGLVVASAVAIPDIGQWLARWWRCGSAWLVLAILVFESVLRLNWTLNLGDSGRVRVDVALLLVVFIVLATLRWRVVCECWFLRVRSSTKPDWWFALVLVLVALALIMVVVNYHSPRFDGVRFRTGIAYASSWAFALCFALTAFALASVRRVCLVLVLVFMLSALFAWYWPLAGGLEDLPLLFAERGWPAVARFFYTHVMVDAVCAALLGAILAPYLRSKIADSLRTPSTPQRLGLIMAVQFGLLPFVSGGSFYADTLVLAGVAFVGGALWRDRALLAVPTLVLVCYFAASALVIEASHLAAVMSDLLRLGFVLFPFTLAGVLSHPYIALVTPVASLIVSPGASPAVSRGADLRAHEAQS